MEKYFANYNQSLALKELGYDEPCFGVFDTHQGNNWLLNIKSEFYYGQFSNKNKACLAPLKSQVFEWFREKYNLVFNFISYNIVKPAEYHWSITWNDEAKASGIVKTYEEAELACIDKLIEIVRGQR